MSHTNSRYRMIPAKELLYSLLACLFATLLAACGGEDTQRNPVTSNTSSAVALMTFARGS